MKISDYFSRWFGASRDENEKEKAIAFVDYEHWYYSYRKMLHIQTDVLSWRKELDERFQI